MSVGQIVALWVGALCMATVRLIAGGLVEKAWRTLHHEPPQPPQPPET